MTPVIFAPTVSIPLDRRSACVSQVSVKPLLVQNRDECGEWRDQSACVHQSSNDDDLGGSIFLGVWNRRGLVRCGGLVEGEDNRSEESCGSFVWV